MGIPYYFYTLYKKYANTKLMLTEHDMNEKLIEHLFFDYNSMIHPCAHQVLETHAPANNLHSDKLDLDKFETDIEYDIIQHTLGYTRYVIDMLKPKYVHIMIDGVAPRAKINQQRERRYKSHFLKNIQPDTTANVNERIEWDTNKITPGTGFMNKLNEQLLEFRDVMMRDNTRLENIYISDSQERGEGEHKMMKVIDEIVKKEDAQETNKSNKNGNKSSTIFIYGLDADLIMLSLLSTASERIVLLRDNTFNNKLKESQRTFTYLDIKQLQGAIYEEVRILCNDQKFSYPKQNVIADYIFLCFMMGNDFLQHVPSLMIKENGINALMKFYIATLRNWNYKPLVSLDVSIPLPQRICWEMLKDILKGLSSSEDYFFKSVYSVYKKNESIYKDTDLTHYNTNDENKCIYFCFEDSVKFNEPGYKSRYYSYYGITDVDKACHDYLTGLLWVWGYYNGHEHDNWSWFYPHHETPFVSDLYNYVEGQLLKLIGDNELKPTDPNTPLEQLMMVLPRNSLLGILQDINPNLYSKMNRIFGTNSSILDTLYPKRIIVDMLHKEYLWQSKLFIEPYERDMLRLLI